MNLLLWIGLPVLLFWSVGAYNRLVRLRAEANAAFAALDAQWQRQLALVQSSLPDEFQTSQFTLDGAMIGDGSELWAGLRGASTQFATSLAAMRARPPRTPSESSPNLHASRAGALRAAQDVLLLAWQRVSTDAHDLAGAAMPETVAAQWQQLMQDTHRLQAQFNDAVTRYNVAIAQFPAVLLAWLFGFKAARPV